MQTQNIELPGIESKIYLIRGEKVMFDFDLAELYQVPTKRLKEQVKRNQKRFPSDFAFSLTNQELIVLRSQFATSSHGHGGRRTIPMVFTEHGISMLSSVLHSDRAIEMNIAIIRTFVKLRQILLSNKDLAKRIVDLEMKYDGKFETVIAAIKALMSEQAVPRKRIIGLETTKPK